MLTDANTSIFFGTSGPRDAEVVLVGEAWGAEEAAQWRPFVGESGQELRRILAEAGVEVSRVLLTNIVAERPLNNEMWRLFVPREAAKHLPKVGGLYPSAGMESELRRLYKQLLAFPRKLIIAAGNYPLWALTQQSTADVVRESNRRRVPLELQTFAPGGIMTWRGSMWFFEPHTKYLEAGGPPREEIAVLPIIHPAAILRQWAQRAITVHDLRARVPMALRGDWRHSPPPVFWAPPTFDQCCTRLRLWLSLADSGQQVDLAEDIETARRFITCLGLGDSPYFAMAVPFIRKTADGFDSWWSIDQEATIIHLLRKINSHPNIRIVGQNFLYDTQYIQHYMGVTPKLDWDTMLCQNVIFPGTTKALDYLASLYCKYYWYWKEDHKEWDTSGTVEDLLKYNCWDIVRTWECAAAQRGVIKQLRMEAQMSFKMRVNDLCLRMMNRGVLIDTQRRSQLLPELMEASLAIQRELLHIIPQDMVSPGNKTPWYDSATQTKFLFYDQLAFDPVLHQKSGQPTTGKIAYPILRRKYPEFSGLFNRLDTYGSLDNTIQVINSKVDADGRMRCSYNPGGTETHRLSSSKNVFGGGTNLQNLSKGEEDE